MLLGSTAKNIGQWIPHPYETFICRIIRINLEMSLPCYCMTAGKTLYYMSERVGIFSHSHTRASVRSGADVGWWDVAHERCSNSSWWCLVGFRSWLCEAQSGCFTLDSINHFFMCILVSTQDHCHSEIEYIHSILIKKYVQ